MSGKEIADTPSVPPRWVERVLRFWFEEIEPAAWFRTDAALDERIRASFADIHEAIARDLPSEATATANGALAAVIVLDQFPRNMFRGEPRAFATDVTAQRVAEAAINAGFDRLLSDSERLFLYLPFEHSEDRARQARSVELFRALGNAEWQRYAEEHRQVIDRFGRFPHRNAILGRGSTPEELAFLQRQVSGWSAAGAPAAATKSTQCWIGFALALYSMLAVTSAWAHEIRPAVVTFDLAAEGRYEALVAINLEAVLAEIGPEHTDSTTSPNATRYNALRALPPAELKSRFEAASGRWLEAIDISFDGTRSRPVIGAIEVPEVGDTALARISRVVLTGRVPAGAEKLRWAYPAALGPSVLRIRRAGADELETAWLKAGEASAAFAISGAAPTGTLARFVEYVTIGFTHILPKGLDHILFVLGLYLLSTKIRPLLVQVTAFTIAHSITLALGLYGIVRVSPAIVEPLIALSIVYVAVENLLTSKLQPWRPVVVFGFGLLHGLGFAGVLQEIGLPRSEYATGLVGFNVGVEFGQLAVIALAWLSTGLWFRDRPWYRTRIVWPGSAAIALAGLFWTVERVLFA